MPHNPCRPARRRTPPPVRALKRGAAPALPSPADAMVDTRTSGSSASPLGAMPNTTSATYASRSRLLTAFDAFAAAVTRWSGSPLAFGAAVAAVAVWASTGRLFDFSEMWQLVINTGTTIVTFLMVFLIQHGQNKDSVALHLKLNELLAANRHASNRMIGIEALDEDHLRAVSQLYADLADRACRAGSARARHSIEEAPIADLGRSA